MEDNSYIFSWNTDDIETELDFDSINLSRD